MLLIFDVDGTLIDSRAFILESARRTFADGAVPYPGDAAFLATIGLLPERMMDRLFPDHPQNARALLATRYIEQVWAMRDEQAGAERPYDGIDRMLATLGTAGPTLGIATGKKRIGVDHMLRQTGWEPLFSTLQTAECGPSKPDPTLIRRAMAETGHGPSATVMIGDSVFDMQMARAAGVTAIGVSWGYNSPATLQQAGADRLVGSVAELLDLLIAYAHPGSATAGASPVAQP